MSYPQFTAVDRRRAGSPRLSDGVLANYTGATRLFLAYSRIRRQLDSG